MSIKKESIIYHNSNAIRRNQACIMEFQPKHERVLLIQHAIYPEPYHFTAFLDQCFHNFIYICGLSHLDFPAGEIKTCAHFPNGR